MPGYRGHDKIAAGSAVLLGGVSLLVAPHFTTDVGGVTAVLVGSHLACSWCWLPFSPRLSGWLIWCWQEPRLSLRFPYMLARSWSVP